MYVMGPQHSITGGKYPPQFARIDAYGTYVSVDCDVYIFTLTFRNAINGRLNC